MQCPHCSAQLPEDDLFCEECGEKLDSLTPSAGVPVCTCGAPAAEIDADGFCGRCGKRVRRPDSDHVEVELSANCAAVSDRGLLHRYNEDRFALRETRTATAMVLCDGVSSSRHADAAAARAAECAVDALAASRAGDPDSEAAIRSAIAAAAEAVAELQRGQEGSEAPSATVVAALARPGEITVGWLGDSRAYWVADGTLVQLTTDHSWLSEAVASGMLTSDEAASAPQAHAITRWLGGDVASAMQPDVVRHPVAGPGLLLLCSDGLWNYAPAAGQMAALVTGAEAQSPRSLDIARHLVDYAKDQGGQDNITAAVLRLFGNGAEPPPNKENGHE